jgi:hypothetical protein
MTGKNAPLAKNKSIFDYLVSESDKKMMRKAMEKAVMCFPQAIEFTFCHRCKTAAYLCHIYRSEQGYFIGGWKRPDNIVRLYNYICL